MGYACTVLADSVSPAGARITTFEVTFPRLVLAEFNTHRVFSRNSASSRAIPVATQLRRVLEAPYVPAEFGTNQPGMQAGPNLAGERHERARQEWLAARDAAVGHVIGLITEPGTASAGASAAELLELVEQLRARIAAKDVPDAWLNVHKQLANRLLEPFMWHTLIVTSTEWENFFHLRAHPDAQPEIQEIAERMRAAYEASSPREVVEGAWHLPLVGEHGGDPAADAALSGEELLKVAVGRCARVSYLTHGGTRDPSADITLHDRLLESAHLSPFEHPARPMTEAELAESAWSGNFRGWHPYRKDIPHEWDALGAEPLVTSG